MKQRGFTLLEVLVALTIISIIVVIVGNVFVHILDLQRRAVNIQQAEENATFVLESMAKEIRVAQIDTSSPNTNCPLTPGDTLKITNQDGDTVLYYLSTISGVGSVVREINGVRTVLSSNTVTFSRLAFCITGAQLNDSLQPRVTIIAKVSSLNTQDPAIVETQVTISPRYLSN